MAALTWKNVDTLNTSAVDSYAKFAEMFGNATNTLSEGIKGFQDTRKSQAAMAVQRLLESQTKTEQLNNPDTVNKLLKDIPQELLTPEVFAQIEAKRKSLQGIEKHIADLDYTDASKNSVLANTELTNAKVATEGLTQDTTKQAIAENKLKLEYLPEKLGGELDLLKAQIVDAKAKPSQENRRIDILNRELDLSKDRHNFDKQKYADELKKITDTDARNQFIQGIANAVNTTASYADAKKLLDSPDLKPTEKAILTETLAKRFPNTFSSENLPNESIPGNTLPSYSDSSPFAPLKDLRVKTVSGATDTLGKFGVTGVADLNKAGIHFNGGATEQGTLAALSLAQGTLGDRLIRSSGTNDDWHQKNSPESTHTDGLSSDITVQGGKKDYEQAAKELRNAYTSQGLVEGKHFTVLDEANFPSSKATEDHIHIELTPEGAKKLATVQNDYESGEAKRRSDLVNEIKTLSANSTSIVDYAKRATDGIGSVLGVGSLKLPEGADKNDPTVLGNAVAAQLGLPPETGVVLARDIQSTLTEEHGKGNLTATPLNVAEAYLASTTKTQGARAFFGNFFPGYTDSSLNSNKLEEALKNATSTTGVEAKALVERQKTALADYQTSVGNLDKLKSALDSALMANSQGADNANTIAQLKSAVTQQVEITKAQENKVREIIDKIDKQRAAKAAIELSQNPASENYIAE